MLLRQLFDKQSSTYTELIADDTSKVGVLADPVLKQVEQGLQPIEELG